MPKIKIHPRWERMTRLHILMASLVLCLAGTELLLRWWGILEVDSNVLLDHQLGWISPEISQNPPLITSSGGVVVLGDSFTAPRQGYVARVERKLGEAGIDATIQNLAVTGYGTVQELEMWRLYGWKYKPRVVILAVFLWNDPSDNINDLYYNPYCNINRPAAVWSDGSLRIIPQSWFRYLWIRASQYSYLVRLLYDEWILILHAQHRVVFYGGPAQWGPFYLPVQNPRAKQGYQLMEALIRQLEKEVKQLDATLVVVAFDNAFTVESECRRQLAQQYPFFPKLALNQPVRELQRFTHQNDIRFLNLEQVLIDYKKMHPSKYLYLPFLAGHFTGLGEEVVARSIAQYLEKERLLPSWGST